MAKISLEDFLAKKQEAKWACKACEHPEKEKLDRAIAAGAPLSHVAEWTRLAPPYVSAPTLKRHRDHAGK